MEVASVIDASDWLAQRGSAGYDKIYFFRKFHPSSGPPIKTSVFLI